MYVTVIKGKMTDWYGSHTGVSYKVVREGDDHYLVQTDALGSGWRIIAKDDCEEKKTFCDEVKEHMMAQHPRTPDESLRPDAHYDNSNGSLYKFAQDHGLNAWEFDIIKRITRCRNKGQFKEDLEKTKRVIDLYLKEYMQ